MERGSRDIRICVAAEGCDPPVETRRFLTPNDPILQACISRLCAVDAAEDDALDGQGEEAALRLVLRITELTGGGLKDRSRPLAHIALDLGFSSQSHFTHLFGGLTGMTPAKYRKQFKRTVG